MYSYVALTTMEFLRRSKSSKKPLTEEFKVSQGEGGKSQEQGSDMQLQRKKSFSKLGTLFRRRSSRHLGQEESERDKKELVIVPPVPSLPPTLDFLQFSPEHDSLPSLLYGDSRSYHSHSNDVTPPLSSCSTFSSPESTPSPRSPLPVGGNQQRVAILRSTVVEEDDYGAESDPEEVAKSKTREQAVFLPHQRPAASLVPSPRLVIRTPSPRRRPLTPRATELLSYTISRLSSPPSSPESALLVPTSTRPFPRTANYRQTSSLHRSLGHLLLLQRMKRGLTLVDEMEIGKGALEADDGGAQGTKTPESPGILSGKLMNGQVSIEGESSSTNLETHAIKQSQRFSLASGPTPTPSSIVTVYPQIRKWASRSTFTNSHLEWSIEASQVVSKPIRARTQNLELSGRLKGLVDLVVVGKVGSSSKGVDDEIRVEGGALSQSTSQLSLAPSPHIYTSTSVSPSSPTYVSRSSRQITATPSISPLPSPTYRDSIYLSPHHASLDAVRRKNFEVRTAELEAELEELRLREREREAELAREREFRSRRKSATPVQVVEESPRQKELRRRAEEQKRRSLLMHSKIEPKKRTPERRRSTLQPSPLPSPTELDFRPASQLLLPYSTSYLLPPPNFPNPNTVYQSARFSTSAPVLYRSPSMPVILTPHYQAAPAPRTIPTPVKSRSIPSPSPAIPRSPPRQLTVVPPPPTRRISQYTPQGDEAFLSSPPHRNSIIDNSSRPLLAHSKSSPALARRSTNRLSVQPLLQGVRPPAAWTLPLPPQATVLTSKSSADFQAQYPSI